MGLQISASELKFLRQYESEIRSADIVIPIGASHSGKSTFAKAIMMLFGKVLVPEKIVSYPINEAKKFKSREKWHVSQTRNMRYKLMINALKTLAPLGCVADGWVAPKECKMLKSNFQTFVIGVHITWEMLEKRIKMRGDKAPDAYVKPAFEGITQDWDKYPIDATYEATDEEMLDLSPDLPEDVEKFFAIWESPTDKKEEPMSEKPKTEPPLSTPAPTPPVTQEENKERKAEGLPMLCPKCNQTMEEHYHSPFSGKEVICLKCSGRSIDQFKKDEESTPAEHRKPDHKSAAWPKDVPWPGKPEEGMDAEKVPTKGVNKEEIQPGIIEDFEKAVNKPIPKDTNVPQYPTDVAEQVTKIMEKPSGGFVPHWRKEKENKNDRRSKSKS